VNTVDPRTLLRLCDYLNRAASDHDGEALTSIRFASRLIKTLNLTWTQLICHSLSPAPKRVKTYTDQITEMFEACFDATPTGSYRHKFLESMANQFRKKGYLSAKQRVVLERIYDEIH
jgi:hypothetical protein